MGRFRFTDGVGKTYEISQIKNPSRTLDLWRGIQTAEFTVHGKLVRVTTLVHPDIDMVTTRVESELLGTGDLVIGLDFPYPVNSVGDKNENGVGDNPAFESAYWRRALAKAQEWRQRMGLPRMGQWDQVLTNLTPLPQADGVYLFCDNWLNTYTQHNVGHPDPLSVCAFLPFVNGVDKEIARRTVEKIHQEWNWSNTWGWDFPLGAMAAARVGYPEIAVGILMNKANKNDFALNGIKERWYFPGNGGLLYAVAMMAAGWDGAPARNAPGFPDNGQWVVKWEGLKKAL